MHTSLYRHRFLIVLWALCLLVGATDRSARASFTERGSSVLGGANFDSRSASLAEIPGVNDPFDLTGDGVIDNADVDQWLAEAASGNGVRSPYQRGDANLDGAVDGSDFNAWNAHKFLSALSWDAGNFDGNALVDGSDFNLWNSHKFTSSATVPEPAAALLGLAFLGSMASQQRR